MKSELKVSIVGFAVVLTVSSCGSRSQQPESPFANKQEGRIAIDLDRIQDNGELIILTRSGRETCFEFRGEYFGRQYMLANEFAKSIGTSIRIEMCHSDEEMISMLKKGEGDVIAYNLPDSVIDSNTEDIEIFKGDTIIQSWAVSSKAPLLGEALSKWIKDNKGKLVALSTLQIRTSNGKVYTPRRRVSAPIRNLAKGEISVYDDLFKKYASMASWDWKLLAAQSYQESAFDPEAVSFMGAMGLMQLMPKTARDVGVSQDDVFVPEHNIRGAVRLINRLNEHYSFIHDKNERINFILAAYNAGPGHVDDARAVAEKYGKDPNVWNGNVDGWVLRMSESRFYNLPEVKNGYFRGSETYNYVNSIRSRWEEYRRKIGS